MDTFSTVDTCPTRVQAHRHRSDKTRMHSSRMRTGRSLTVCRSQLLPGGVCLLWVGGLSAPGGVGGSAPGGLEGSGQGGCLLLGGYLLPGGLVPGVSGPGGSGLGGVCYWGGLVPGDGIPACTEADPPPPPPVDRITDACKNITLAQLRCGR